MKEKLVPQKKVIEVFARQIEIAGRKQMLYQNNPEQISKTYPALKGHEKMLLRLATYVRTTERVNLGYLYNQAIGDTLNTVSVDSWRRLNKNT